MNLNQTQAPNCATQDKKQHMLKPSRAGAEAACEKRLKPD